MSSKMVATGWRVILGERDAIFITVTLSLESFNYMKESIALGEKKILKGWKILAVLFSIKVLIRI